MQGTENVDYGQCLVVGNTFCVGIIDIPLSDDICFDLFFDVEDLAALLPRDDAFYHG